jgi:2-hydroxychromene-2-carboxylate isomerase
MNNQIQCAETERFLRRHSITKFGTNPFFQEHACADAGCCRGRFQELFEPFPRRLSSVLGGTQEDGDSQIFRDAFLSSGLDIDRINARAQQDDVKKKLIENTNNAVARGTFGSPTFFVGNEIYFGKDSLRDVEDEIVAQSTGAQRKTA